MSAARRARRSRTTLGFVLAFALIAAAGGGVAGCNAILGIDDHELGSTDAGSPSFDASLVEGGEDQGALAADVVPDRAAESAETGPCEAACDDTSDATVDHDGSDATEDDGPGSEADVSVDAANDAVADVTEEPCVADAGSPCGQCGGTTECNGTCSVPNPSGFGNECGSCGGVIGCNGACTVTTPSDYGQSCGSCGGKIECNGTCSVSTPSNFGQTCNSGCGAITCSGVCSTPPNDSTYGGLCPTSTGTAIAAGGTYGNYQVQSITLAGAIPGVYTFSIASGDAGLVTLLRDGVSVATLGYIWQTTVLGPSASPVLTYSFNFANYFDITVLGAISPIGTLNLYDLNDNSIFDGAHYISVCCQ